MNKPAERAEKVVVVASKTCAHYPLLEKELRACGVRYDVRFVEDQPELIERYGLYQSPNMVVGGEVAFRGLASHPLPSHIELEQILKAAGILHEHKSKAPNESKQVTSETPRRSEMSKSIERAEKRETSQTVPQPVNGDPGLVQVDPTWGKIQPMQVVEGVRPVGELEVRDHLEQELPVVDSRNPDSYKQATIPGAMNLPFPEATSRMDELNQRHPTVFFCNGPQCGQSPTAIRNLLEAGYPPEKILYYRGGLHDWITLGLPVTGGTQSLKE